MMYNFSLLLLYKYSNADKSFLSLELECLYSNSIEKLYIIVVKWNFSLSFSSPNFHSVLKMSLKEDKMSTI